MDLPSWSTWRCLFYFFFNSHSNLLKQVLIDKRFLYSKVTVVNKILGGGHNFFNCASPSHSRHVYDYLFDLCVFYLTIF